MNNDIRRPTTRVVTMPPEAKATPPPLLMADNSDNKPSKSKFKQLKHWLNERVSRKKLIIGGVVFVLLLAGGIAFGLTHQAAAPQPNIVATKPKPKPVVYTSRLTGVVVTQAQSILPVTGVMIENSDAARPQSGLMEAGVVFEAIAEGGVTRFLALYEEGQPDSIGPIRSARPYYVHWLLPFDAAYAHVGGSPDGLSAVQALNVKDMNQFYNGSYYTRITSRYAPHNVYSSMAKLLSLEQSKGWTTSSFTGFLRKADSPSKSPTATSIDLNISGPDFNPHYDYVASSNSYARSEGGAKHIDAVSGAPLSPKVVIAMVVPWTNGVLDATGAYYTNYSDIGSGAAYIFQDGIVTIGTWNKASIQSQLAFTDSSGKPIKLNAGQTWISAVGAAAGVVYKQ